MMNSDVTQLANAMRHQPKPKPKSVIIPMALPWPWRRWTASALGMILATLSIYGAARGLIWIVNWLL
jgi:hypothetical protein